MSTVPARWLRLLVDLVDSAGMPAALIARGIEGQLDEPQGRVGVPTINTAWGRAATFHPGPGLPGRVIREFDTRHLGGPGRVLRSSPSLLVALERLVFEDLGDGRTRLTATSLVDSFEARDAFVAGGMEEGVRDGYERLDGLLTG